MSLRLRQLLVSIAVFLTCMYARAEQRIDLYSTDVLVASQSAEERQQVARDGLAEVVVRISGRSDSLEQPAIAAALEHAQDYLLEFSYDSTELVIERDGSEVVASRLNMRFAPNAIEQLVRQSNLPLWPANRPELLLWLVEDTRSDGRNYLTAPEFIEPLNDRARRRGVPLQHPLLDLEDQMSAAPDELWQLDALQVAQASSRYSADIAVVGRLSEISRRDKIYWIANWQLFGSDFETLLETQAETRAAVIAAGIDAIAEALSGHYAIVPTESLSGDLWMQLQGVDDYADYIGAIDYLQGLAMIAAVNVESVSGTELWLSLKTEGDLDLLLRALARSDKLHAQQQNSIGANPYAISGSRDNPLRYYWGAAATASAQAIDVNSALVEPAGE